MNEASKTITFAGVAVAALAIGWFVSRPNAPEGPPQEGQFLSPDFVDDKKLGVTGAEIVSFDPTTDTKNDLKVARVDGQWTINPERQGYPEMDAKRLADVIGAVSDLKVLSVVGEDRSKHREFGVVDPGNDAELKEGSEGVGKRVEILDDAKRPVVQLIIGKADEKNPKLHFVRKPGQDRIYRTEVDAEKLSSRFDDWVKPDLLGSSNAGDLRYAAINDYGIDLEQSRRAPMVQGGVMIIPPAQLVQVPRSKAVLEKKPVMKEGSSTPTDEWQIADYQTYEKADKSYKARPLASDEELESFKISDLGRELGKIKIADAVKKPEELAKVFAAEKNFLNDPNAQLDPRMEQTLQNFGFFSSADGTKLVCMEGEMTAGFADGVEYVLRFGDITGKGSVGDAADDKKAESGEAKDGAAPADGAAQGSNTAPNRYLLVTARFNQNLMPKPKLTELPPETPAAAAPTSGEKKPEEPKPADAEKKPTKVEADDDANGEKGSSCDQEPAADKKADEPKQEGDEKKAPEAKSTEEPKPAEPAKPAMTAEERKRIEEDNKARQEKYEADVKAGRERAKELNARFADWFYVVSDATYQKMNVDPSTLIRKKAGNPTPSGPAPLPNENPLQGLQLQP